MCSREKYRVHRRYITRGRDLILPWTVVPAKETVFELRLKEWAGFCQAKWARGEGNIPGRGHCTYKGLRIKERASSRNRMKVTVARAQRGMMRAAARGVGRGQRVLRMRMMWSNWLFCCCWLFLCKYLHNYTPSFYSFSCPLPFAHGIDLLEKAGHLSCGIPTSQELAITSLWCHLTCFSVPCVSYQQAFYVEAWFHSNQIIGCEYLRAGAVYSLLCGINRHVMSGCCTFRDSRIDRWV